MKKSVCFTGHRTIAEDKEKLSARLYTLLERLVTEQKVTDFYTGGAVGWDALAALTVLKLRESYPEVKLHLVLPCPFEEQSAKWNEAQKEEHKHIASLADLYHNQKTGFRSYFLSFSDGARIEIMNRLDIVESSEKEYRTGYAHIAFSVGSADEVNRLTELLRNGYALSEADPESN